jgi:hypothetical protein
MTKAPSPTTSLTPEEKLQTLFQDQALRNAERRKSASTFPQFANSEANADAGRFAAINKANVAGAKAVPDYPNQPQTLSPTKLRLLAWRSHLAST